MLTEARPPVQNRQAQDSKSSPTPGANIFIVEDDTAITNLIRTFLIRSGYRVAGSAKQGDEALVQIERLQPDLILMDIALEGELDGIQTATVVGARFELPVVFLTGLADDETLNRSQQAQAFGYLLKPFEQEDLRAAIDLGLSKHKVENRLRHVDRWFAAAIRSISDAVIATDQTDQITFLNPVAERLTGQASAQSLGRPLNSIFRLCDEPNLSAPVPIAVRKPARSTTGELQFDAVLATAGGERVPIECSSAPIKNSDGQTIGRIIVFRDVSVRQQAEFELSQSWEQLRALAGHLQMAREAERMHIAREIHDEFGQLLTGLRMDLVWMEKRLNRPEDEESVPALRRKLTGTLELVDGMVKQVRRIAGELRPGVLDDLGLIPALEWQAREWQERTGVQCCFTSSHDQLALPPETRTALFRIFQEALTNVARHARATKVTAEITVGPDSIQLVIADNGQGFVEQPGRKPSFGLIGMRERAVMAGGTLVIDGKPGAGTTVIAEVPKPLADAA